MKDDPYHRGVRRISSAREDLVENYYASKGYLILSKGDEKDDPAKRARNVGEPLSTAATFGMKRPNGGPEKAADAVIVRG